MAECAGVDYRERQRHQEKAGWRAVKGKEKQGKKPSPAGRKATRQNWKVSSYPH